MPRTDSSLLAWASEEAGTKRRDLDRLNDFIGKPELHSVSLAQRAELLRLLRTAIATMGEIIVDHWRTARSKLSGRPITEVVDMTRGIASTAAQFRDLLADAIEKERELLAGWRTIDATAERQAQGLVYALWGIVDEAERDLKLLSRPRRELDPEKVAEAVRRSREEEPLEAGEVLASLRALSGKE